MENITGQEVATWGMQPDIFEDAPILFDKLDALAELAVRVGLGPDMPNALIVRAPLESVPFARRIAHYAYRHGVGSVTCLYDDPLLLRDRLACSSLLVPNNEPDWLPVALAGAFTKQSACIDILGPYPDLLNGIPTERIVRAHLANHIALRPVREAMREAHTRQVQLAWVTTSWARQVFPTRPHREAIHALWQIILAASRANMPAPEIAWKEHQKRLLKRQERLQEGGYHSIHIYDARSDLIVGLAMGHRWQMGTAPGQIRSFPSEALYTCPSRAQAEGILYLARPIIVGGRTIDGGRLEFRGGQVVSVYADQGQDVLEQLMVSDEGARRLGKIALVPASSPLAAHGLSFYCALLDENACSHVTLGQHDAECIDSNTGGYDCGANFSALHLDCMFGQADTAVDGLLPNGSRAPLMRHGEFLF